MTTRSVTLFASVAAANAVATLFTCPAATHTIVKSVLLYNPGADPSEVLLLLARTSAGVSMRLYQATMVAGEDKSWEGWVVLQPSDVLQLYSAVSAVHTWGSGALLPQPPS